MLQNRKVNNIFFKYNIVLIGENTTKRRILRMLKVYFKKKK